MSLDQLAGRRYPSTPPYEVCREKIREFAEAIGADDPAYRDPSAARALGHPDVIAPPTFPVLLTMAAGRQVLDDPDLDIDYSRVVHGDQRFHYVRPIYAGDRLRCACVLEEVVSRGGHRFVTIRTDVNAEQDGAHPVVTVWTKLVVRGEG